MDIMINLYASLTGAWKKVAHFLPLVIGAGTLLTGIAGFLLEIGHSANASGLLHILQNIQSDPNTALILAGLGALGVHTNHTNNAQQIQSINDPLGH